MQQENVLEMIFLGLLFEWQEDIWPTALCFLLRLFTETDNGVQALSKSVHCLINTVKVKVFIDLGCAIWEDHFRILHFTASPEPAQS